MGTCGRRFLRAFSSNGLFFSGEKDACQELFNVLALPVSSAQSAAHFLAGFSAVIARVALSNLLKWQCDRSFNLYYAASSMAIVATSMSSEIHTEAQ